MIGNLYLITNTENNKVYVGKTYKTLEERFNAHIRERNNKDRPLYRAFNKYGIDKFSIQLLGTFEEDELELQEELAIEKFNSFGAGYNATKGGDGRRYLTISNAEIEADYNKTLNMAQTARNLRISKESVSNALKHLDTKKSKPIFCQELNTLFDSVTEAAKLLIECEFTRSNKVTSVSSEINKVLKGLKSSYLGLTFMAPSSNG